MPIWQATRDFRAQTFPARGLTNHYSAVLCKLKFIECIKESLLQEYSEDILKAGHGLAYGIYRKSLRSMSKKKSCFQLSVHGYIEQGLFSKPET